MKKMVIAASLAAMSMAAQAEGWRLAPGFKEQGFRFDPSLAATVNYVDPKDYSSDTGLGVDFNFNCGLIQDPQNRIRTHLQYGRIDKGDLTANAFELSPRYTVPLNGGFSVGVGPSVAMYQVSMPGYDKNLFGYGVAGGVNFRSGALFLGADARYHNTQSKGGKNFDNFTLGVKAGINF
jgi:long-subunit fatty acid transport protein